MLTSIKKVTKSFLGKVLIGIIILPFVFWGMGDVFRTGNQNIVVTIDSEKVTAQSFVEYVNMLNLNEEQRNNLRKSDLLDRILSDYIGKKIISLEISDHGINVNNQSLKEIIVNDKTFKKDYVTIIHQSDRVPPPPLSYSKKIPLEDRKKIKKAVLEEMKRSCLKN